MEEDKQEATYTTHECPFCGESYYARDLAAHVERCKNRERQTERRFD